MNTIVIVGGGFGGFQAALRLEEALGRRRSVRLILINDENHFTYTPILPDIATGSLTMRTGLVRLASVLDERAIRIVKDRVLGFDLEAQAVIGERERIPYDYLLIAVGAESNFHGISGLVNNVIPFRTVHDAMRIKARVLSAFRRASAGLSEEECARVLTFTIAGAGCCGVQLAAEIASGVRRSLLPQVDPALARHFRVLLIEPKDTLLSRFDPRMTPVAQEALDRLGVEVRYGDRVIGADGAEVELEGGDVIACENVIWAAGVRAPRWLESSGLTLSEEGRVAVYDSLETLDHDGIFAVGDCAEILDLARPLPMNAQVASQQGVVAAENIINHQVGSSFSPFEYLHFGDLITLGRMQAAASWGPVSISGPAAFAVYRATYAAMAPTLTKKVAVLADWSEEFVRGRDWGRLLLSAE